MPSFSTISLKSGYNIGEILLNITPSTMLSSLNSLKPFIIAAAELLIPLASIMSIAGALMDLATSQALALPSTPIPS